MAIAKGRVVKESLARLMTVEWYVKRGMGPTGFYQCEARMTCYEKAQ
jgi:hypothetical protein